MTPDQIYKEIETFTGTNWTATKYTFGDLPFQKGDEVNANDPWVRFLINLGAAKALELGRLGVGIRSGDILADVFTPEFKLRQGALLAGQIESLFRRKNINGVQCYEPETKNVSQKKDQWIHHLVKIPFTTITGE